MALLLKLFGFTCVGICLLLQIRTAARAAPIAVNASAHQLSTATSVDTHLGRRMPITNNCTNGTLLGGTADTSLLLPCAFELQVDIQVTSGGRDIAAVIVDTASEEGLRHVLPVASDGMPHGGYFNDNYGRPWGVDPATFNQYLRRLYVWKRNSTQGFNLTDTSIELNAYEHVVTVAGDVPSNYPQCSDGSSKCCPISGGFTIHTLRRNTTAPIRCSSLDSERHEYELSVFFEGSAQRRVGADRSAVTELTQPEGDVPSTTMVGLATGGGGLGGTESYAPNFGSDWAVPSAYMSFDGSHLVSNDTAMGSGTDSSLIVGLSTLRSAVVAPSSFLKMPQAQSLGTERLCRVDGGSMAATAATVESFFVPSWRFANVVRAVGYEPGRYATEYTCGAPLGVFTSNEPLGGAHFNASDQLQAEKSTQYFNAVMEPPCTVLSASNTPQNRRVLCDEPTTLGPLRIRFSAVVGEHRWLKLKAKRLFPMLSVRDLRIVVDATSDDVVAGVVSADAHNHPAGDVAQHLSMRLLQCCVVAGQSPRCTNQMNVPLAPFQPPPFELSGITGEPSAPTTADVSAGRFVSFGNTSHFLAVLYSIVDAYNITGDVPSSRVGLSLLQLLSAQNISCTLNVAFADRFNNKTVAANTTTSLSLSVRSVAHRRASYALRTHPELRIDNNPAHLADKDLAARLIAGCDFGRDLGVESPLDVVSGLVPPSAALCVGIGSAGCSAKYKGLRPFFNNDTQRCEPIAVCLDGRQRDAATNRCFLPPDAGVSMSVAPDDPAAEPSTTPLPVEDEILPDFSIQSILPPWMKPLPPGQGGLPRPPIPNEGGVPAPRHYVPPDCGRGVWNETAAQCICERGYRTDMSQPHQTLEQMRRFVWCNMHSFTLAEYLKWYYEDLPSERRRHEAEERQLAAWLAGLFPTGWTQTATFTVCCLAVTVVACVVNEVWPDDGPVNAE